MTLPWMMQPSPRVHEVRAWRGCANCAHFETRPLMVEGALPGASALASGFASVRGDDGYCRHHDRLLGASSSCPQHAARTKPG